MSGQQWDDKGADDANGFFEIPVGEDGIGSQAHLMSLWVACVIGTLHLEPSKPGSLIYNLGRKTAQHTPEKLAPDSSDQPGLSSSEGGI